MKTIIFTSWSTKLAICLCTVLCTVKSLGENVGLANNERRGESNSHALNTFLQNVLRARQELLWLKNSSMQLPDQQLYASPRKRTLKEYPSRKSIKSVDVTNGKYSKVYSSDSIPNEYSSISEEENRNSDEDVMYGTSSNNLQYVPKQVFDEHLKSGIRNQRTSSYNELGEDYDDQEPVFTEEKFDRNNRRKRSTLKKKKKKKRKKKKRRLKTHKSNTEIVRPRDINIDTNDARGNWMSFPIEHTINETSRSSPQINYYDFQPEKFSVFEEYSEKLQPINMQLNSSSLGSTLNPETFFDYNEDSFTASISPTENSFRISFPQESNMLSRSGVSLRSSNSEFPTYINQSFSDNILPIENTDQNDTLSSQNNEIMGSASNSTLHKSSESGSTKLDSPSSYDTFLPSEELQNNAMNGQPSTKLLSSDNLFNNTSDTSDTLLGDDVRKSPIENLNIPHTGTNSFSLASIPSHPLLIDSSADNSNNILAGNVLNTFPSLDSINNNLSDTNTSISSAFNNSAQMNKIHSPLDNISSDMSPKKSYTLETVHSNISNNSAATDSLNLSLFNDVKLSGKENNLSSMKTVEPLTQKFQTNNTPKGQNEAGIKLGKVLENVSQIKNDDDIATPKESADNSNPDSQANNGYFNINNKQEIMTSPDDFEITIGSRSIKHSDKEANTFFDEQDDSDDRIYMDDTSVKADINRNSRESVTPSGKPQQAKLNIEYKTIPSGMETVPETSNPLVSNVELSSYDIKYKVADKSPETDASENVESYALKSKTSHDASHEALSIGSDIFPDMNNFVQRSEDKLNFNINNHDSSKLVVKRSITSGRSMEISELVADDQDSQLSPLFENILLKKLNASRSENESIDFVGKFRSKAECDREKKRKEQELESNLKNLIDVNSKFVYTNHNVEENVALSDDPVSLMNSFDISLTTKYSLPSPDSQESEDKTQYIFREIRSVGDSARVDKNLVDNFAENTDGKVEVSTRSIVQQTSSDSQYFQEIQKLFGHEDNDLNAGLKANKSSEGDPKLNIRRSQEYDNRYLNPGLKGRRINEGYYVPEEEFQTGERSTFSGLGITMDNEGEPGQRRFENIYFTARIFTPGIYTLKPEWGNISNNSEIGGFKKMNFYDETLSPSEIPENKGLNFHTGFNDMNEVIKLGPQMSSGFNEYSTSSIPARDFTMDGVYDTAKTTAYQPLFQNLMNSPSDFEYQNPITNMTMSSLSAMKNGFDSEVLNADRNTVNDFEPSQELPIFGSYDAVRDNELKNIISKDIKMSSFVSPTTFNVDQNYPSRQNEIQENYEEMKMQRNEVPLNTDQQTTTFNSVPEKIYESQNQNHDQNIINSMQSKSYNSLNPSNGEFNSENVHYGNFNSIQKNDNPMYHNQENPILNDTTGKTYGSKNQNQQERIISDSEPKHFSDSEPKHFSDSEPKHFSQVPNNERTNSQIVKSENYEPQNQNPSNFGHMYREDRHQNQRIENPNNMNAEKNEKLDRSYQGKQNQGNMYPIKHDDNIGHNEGREEHGRMKAVDNTGQMIHNEEERGHGNSKSEGYGSSVSLSLGKQSNNNMKMEPMQDSAVLREEKYGATKDQYNKQTHSNVKANVYNDLRNQNRGNEKPVQNGQPVFENQRKQPSNMQEFDKSYDSTNRGQEQFRFSNVKGEKNREPLPQNEERGNFGAMKSENYNDSAIKSIQIKHEGNTGIHPYQETTNKRKPELGKMKVDKNDFPIVHNKNQQPYDQVKTSEYDKPVMQNHSIENMQNQGREEPREPTRMKSIDDNRPTGQMVHSQEDRGPSNTKSEIEKLGGAQTSKTDNPPNEFLEKQHQDNIKTGNKDNSPMKNEGGQVHQNVGAEKVIVTVLQNKDNKTVGREMDGNNGNNEPLKQNAKYNKELAKNVNATNMAHMMSPPHEKVTGNEKIGVYSIIPMGTKPPPRGSNDDKAAVRVHKIPPKHGGEYPMKTENVTKKKLPPTKDVFERVNNNYGTSNSSSQTLLEKHLHLQKQMGNPRKEPVNTTEKGKHYNYEMQAQDSMRNNEEQHGSNRKEQEEKKEQIVHQGPPHELANKEVTQNLGTEDHRNSPTTIVKSESNAGMKDDISNQETNIVETKGGESKMLQLPNNKENLESDHKSALFRGGPSSGASFTNNPEDHKSRPHDTESMKTDNRNRIMEDDIANEEYEIPRVNKGNNNNMVGEEPDLMENNWFFKQDEDNGESSLRLLDAVTMQNRQDIIQDGNSHRRELRNALDSSILQANDKTDEDHSEQLMPNFVSPSGNKIRTRDIFQSSHFPEERSHLSQHGRFSRDAHDKGRKPSDKGVYTPIEHHDDSFPNFLTIPKRPIHYQPSHEEDESQLQEAMSGDLARKIVDAILKKEHEQGELQKHFVLSTDHAKCTDINKQRKLQEEINRHKNEEMMKRVMQILENLAQQEVKDNACTKLTPDLKSFLMWMLDKSEEDIDEGEKEGKDSFLFHQHRHGPPAHNKPPLNVHPFYTAERYNTLPPDPQSIIKKVSLLQKLIHEYENLSSKEKVKVSGIYDNLITNLNTLRNMVGLPEYHGKGSKTINMTQGSGNNCTQGKLTQLKDDHGRIAPNSFNVAHRPRLNEFQLPASASDKAQFVSSGNFPSYQSSGRKSENGKLHSLYDFSAVASPSHDYQLMLKEKADRASIRNQLESLGLSENASNTGSSFANRFLYSIGALNKEFHSDMNSKFSDNNINSFVDPAGQINQAESLSGMKTFRDYRSNPVIRMDQFVNKTSLHHNGPLSYDWKSREFRQLGNSLYDDTEPLQNWKSFPTNSLSKYRHKKDNSYFLGPHRRYRRHHGAVRESASISQVINGNSRNKKTSGEYSLQEKKQNHRQISSQYKRITSKNDAEQHHKRSHNSTQNKKRHKRRKKKQKH